MADEVDIAQQLEELALAQALANVPKGRQLPPKGCCYYCEEPLEKELVNGVLADVRLFCDEHCAADWEYEEKIRRKQFA